MRFDFSIKFNNIFLALVIGFIINRTAMVIRESWPNRDRVYFLNKVEVLPDRTYPVPMCHFFCVPLGDRSKDRAAEKPQILKSEGK